MAHMTKEEFKEARATLGLKQRELAKTLLSTLSTVSKWESGRQTIPALAAKKLRSMVEPTDRTIVIEGLSVEEMTAFKRKAAAAGADAVVAKLIRAWLTLP
jgi:transcriptional regulator with XRE-family HTH domain